MFGIFYPKYRMLKKKKNKEKNFEKEGDLE